MTEIEELKNRLFEKDASLVVKFSNGEIKDYFNKRVIDIVSILKEDENALNGAVVADKIIGKVAATLLTKGKVKKVYTKTLSKFGKEVFDKRQNILKTMIGLTLQELYKDNPDQLKTDIEQASEKGENLGRKIKLAIEEYANTGFSILDHRSKEKPGYIENIEYVIEDILSDKTWNL